MHRWSLLLTLMWMLCVGIMAPVAVAADDATAIRYIALGDSYAYGVGASDPASHGYVGQFTAALPSSARMTVPALDLADPGATSADLIGDYATRGSQGQSQLARAVQLLGAGGVNLVTLDIGGNDILRLLHAGNACADNAIVSDICLAAVQNALLQNTTVNVPRILTALITAAKPGTRIIVLNYPNPYSTGTNSVLEQRTNMAVQGLNTIIMGAVTAAQSVASARGVTLMTVDLFPLFAGRAGTLTHILDTEPDVHPTDAGYRVIADAIITAYQQSAGTNGVGAPKKTHFITRLGG
ncbi:MAG: SGNH/GDSL hydrolase family protein [Thermomicrobiales bacterium]